MYLWSPLFLAHFDHFSRRYLFIVIIQVQST